MAKELNVCINDVVKSGPGLAFIAFPDAISKLDQVPQLMSFLFFVMILTLGLDSMFTLVETITTAIKDHFKALQKVEEWVTIVVCVIGFLCGLTLCFEGGIHMFSLLDHYSASWNILLFALLEVVLVAWCYGGGVLAP